MLNHRQPNFLVMLQSALFSSSVPTSEVAMGCYVIFCKAYTLMVSLPDSSPIRSNAYEFASDLHVSTDREPSSSDTQTSSRRLQSSGRLQSRVRSPFRNEKTSWTRVFTQIC